MRILVVDDEKYSLKILVRKIREIMPDAVIDECEDGVHALEAIQYTGYNIVFIDIMMPAMQGKTLAEMIYGKYPDTQILFETGELEEEVLRLGIQTERCIYKPVATEELRKKIEHLDTLPPSPFRLQPIKPPEVIRGYDAENINSEETEYRRALLQKKKIIPFNLWKIFELRRQLIWQKKM